MGDMGDLRHNRHFGNKLCKSPCGRADKRKLCLNTDSCFGFLSSMEAGFEQEVWVRQEDISLDSPAETLLKVKRESESLACLRFTNE